MYSPWTTSMPCLFSSCLSRNNEKQVECTTTYHDSDESLINSLNKIDLTNPFNLIATSSILSKSEINCFSCEVSNIQQEFKSNYFEPLPFLDTKHQDKQTNFPQLSQKHTIVKQMIAYKTKQQHKHYNPQYTDDDGLFSSMYNRKKRQICTFCKSNGESFNVYASHILRNRENEIECPILRAYVCPKCGATDKSAHTIKYCTALSEHERVALPTVKSFKGGRSSSGNMNLFKKQK